MTTMIYGAATPAPAGSAASHRKNLFERFLNAVYESRMRQAQHEIDRHLHLVPSDALTQAGYEVSVRNDGALPFGR
jgi:hypothetical protein